MHGIFLKQTSLYLVHTMLLRSGQTIPVLRLTSLYVDREKVQQGALARSGLLGKGMERSSILKQDHLM